MSVALVVLLLASPPPSLSPLADAAMVLSGDVGELRTRRAVELLKAGQVHSILLTGSGLGGDSAVYLEQAALRFGAPAESLFLEETSTTTEENFKNAAPLIRKQGWKTLALVTSSFHMRRALWVAREQLPGVEWLPVPVADAGIRARSSAALGEWLKLAWSWLRSWN